MGSKVVMLFNSNEKIQIQNKKKNTKNCLMVSINVFKNKKE